MKTNESLFESNVQGCINEQNVSVRVSAKVERNWQVHIIFKLHLQEIKSL